MKKKNKESIYLDGIESVQNGVLVYTNELLHKVKNAFDVNLAKQVSFDEIDDTAEFIIREIIKKDKKLIN